VLARGKHPIPYSNGYSIKFISGRGRRVELDMPTLPSCVELDKDRVKFIFKRGSGEPDKYRVKFISRRGSGELDMPISPSCVELDKYRHQKVGNHSRVSEKRAIDP
jgi:hypothetical protein